MEKLTRKIETEDMNTFEALEEAWKAGKTICNISEVDAHVLKTKETILSGTCVAHAKRGGTLGATAKKGDLTINIPKKFQGMDDKKLLLIEHPNFTYDAETKTISIPDESKVIIEDLPNKDGLYTPNERGLPNLPKKDNAADRRFWRSDNEFVGLLVRNDNYNDRRDVYADFEPDDRCRVLVK